MLEQFTDANFSVSVEGSATLTLVDFWGEECAPCRALAPVLEQLAVENGVAVRIGKIKVEDNPKTATKYGVRGMPTMLFMKNGGIIEVLVGFRNKAAIQKVIDAHK